MSVTTRTIEMYNGIRESINIPQNILRAADAVRTDLIHGPSWVVVDSDGDIVETYLWREDAESECEPNHSVKPAYDYAGNILRNYIDNLPSMYYEAWSGYVGIGVIDYDTEHMSEAQYIDSGVIIAALFGETISRNFW
jgi:hypothetical protein